MATKRKCSGTTKAGKPCKAPPMKGSDLCLSHDRKEKEARGFGGPQEGSGRPKNPKVSDVLRERLEARMDEVIDTYFDAMKATDRDGDPDHPIRLRAAEAMNDRAYGKPGQSLEVTGAEGGPIMSTDVDDPEVRKLATELLRRRVEATDDSA